MRSLRSSETGVRCRVEFEDTATPSSEPDMGKTFGDNRGELSLGTAIDRYLLLSKLGAGGMGVVYAAYDPELDRKIALKLLLPAVGAKADPGSEGRTRLLREAQALAKLAHPNVVTVHDVGTHADMVWIAMELVAGQTLGAWAQARQRTWTEVLWVLTEAARGVAAAHSVGLVHRDLKPENVMIGRDGRVRVMDFGLAHGRSHGGTEAGVEATLPLDAHAQPAIAALGLRLTAKGSIQGTPAYMAPEQWQGREAEASTDQFGWSVMAWELLYGERPFAGETLIALAAAVLSGRHRPSPRASRVPGWLRRIVERGLKTESSHRWPTMAALLAALEHGRARARSRVASLLFVGIAAVGAGAEGYRRWDAMQHRAACVALGAEIDETWNDDSRDHLRSAFLVTGVGHAAMTADKVVPWLDQASVAWADARMKLCTDVDGGAMSADLVDRATWCLDERRMAIESLIAVLSRADAAVVQRAVAAAATLESSEQCRDAQWLMQMPVPPVESREVLRAVQAELLRAASFQAAGRNVEGLRLAEASLARAEAIAWPPLVASARQRVGSLLAAQGVHFARAEAALEAAYFEAAGAGAPGVLVDAAVDLVYVVGQELARPIEGRRWGRLANVALATLEPQPGLRSANLRNNLGNVHRVAGEYEQSQVLHEQALALREQALDPDHPDVASSLNNLANIHFTRGDVATSRTLHKRALGIRERAFGPEHPDVASSLNNLGNTYYQTEAFAEALALQRRALEIRERTLGLDHLDVANSLNNLAGIYHALDTPGAVVPLLERALVIRERALGPDHPAVAESLGNLALALETLGTPGEARRLHERSLAIHERTLGPDHPAVATNLTDLARIHEASGDLEEARRLLVRALTIRERALGPDHLELAGSLQALATVELALGDAVAATSRARRALAIFTANLGPDDAALADPLECLAGAALAAHRVDEAVGLATRASELLAATATATVPGQVARVDFLLARALWEANRERPRARALALHSRDELRVAGGQEVALADAERWLATLPRP